MAGEGDSDQPVSMSSITFSVLFVTQATRVLLTGRLINYFSGVSPAEVRN